MDEPNVNENEFFRNATLKICSHLEIEKGLSECVKYLRNFMPADGLFIEKADKEYRAFRILVWATAEKGEVVDILAPLAESARKAIFELKKTLQSSNLPPVLVVNNPEEEPITSTVQKYLEVPPSSVLSMPLIVEGEMPATIALIARGNNRYTEEHARLFSLLKEPFFIASSNNLKHRKIIELMDLLQEENRYYKSELNKTAGEMIIGSDFGLKGVMEQAKQVAPLASSVLLLGETGTGKEVIAGAIHTLSPRKDHPFIKVNCGAIPESLMDSTLFGHEKGAFTGAIADKKGLFERAHQGTIFLDEIGELTADAQVRLLRVLQERKYERVGGSKSYKVDIRVIAATHRDLPSLVKEGRFREDLYFRLKVFPIELPPLRDRRGDIPALVQFILQKKVKEMKLGIVPAINDGDIDKLTAYNWPGNVRELENVIERALITSAGDVIRFAGFDDDSEANVPSVAAATDMDVLELDEVVTRHIEMILKKTGGKVEGEDGAAKVLNINPATLRNRMRKLGIKFGRK